MLFITRAVDITDGYIAATQVEDIQQHITTYAILDLKTTYELTSKVEINQEYKRREYADVTLFKIGHAQIYD
jgi:hypothetical protein